MPWTFKIFPPIGVARIGNNTSTSPGDFYVGPEIPGTVIVPPNGYKDSSGKVRRQAARFRIYGWENGVFMGEITSSVADITWTVERPERSRKPNANQMGEPAADCNAVQRDAAVGGRKLHQRLGWTSFARYDHHS